MQVAPHAAGNRREEVSVGLGYLVHVLPVTVTVRRDQAGAQLEVVHDRDARVVLAEREDRVIHQPVTLVGLGGHGP